MSELGSDTLAHKKTPRRDSAGGLFLLWVQGFDWD